MSLPKVLSVLVFTSLMSPVVFAACPLTVDEAQRDGARLLLATVSSKQTMGSSETKDKNKDEASTSAGTSKFNYRGDDLYLVQAEVDGHKNITGVLACNKKKGELAVLTYRWMSKDVDSTTN